MRFLVLTLCVLLFSSPSKTQTLTQIESVEYIDATGQFVVSNGTSIVVVDNTGSPTGYFGNGASAQYGMEVLNNALVVINNNMIVAYDVQSGSSLGSCSIPGVQFLNGMASDGISSVYVTDFSGKKIYKIDCSDFANMTSTTLVNNTTDTPNGICFDGANNRLVYVCWGANAKIKAVDLTTNTTSVLVNGSGLSNMDGIDITPNGDFYCSSWSPARITKYNNDFSSSTVIPVTGLTSPADLCYADGLEILAIPNGNQTVIMVSQPLTAISESNQLINSVELWPNPSSGCFTIALTAKVAFSANLDLIDVTGKVMRACGKLVHPGGRIQLNLSLTDIPQGAYWLRVYGDNQTEVLPILIQ
jgi:sugar lactone lactonase YvrE